MLFRPRRINIFRQFQKPDLDQAVRETTVCARIGGAMTRRDIILLALAGAAIGAAAMASETINYAYDSQGRLVKVVRTGTINNNVSATYSYDKADNRTNVNVISPNAPP